MHRIINSGLSGSAQSITSQFQPSGHLAPEESCQCGIYATTDPRILQEYGKNDVFLCQIRILGKVVIHERGYRGQRGVIERVFIPPYCAQCKAIGPTMIFKSVFICISCWGEKKPSASMSTQSYFEARGVEMVEAWKGNTNLYSEAQ